MYILSAFGDEIDPAIDKQLDVMAAEGITALDLRGVDGINVLKMADEELKRVKAALDSRGMHVASIASPIGKIRIDEPFEPHEHEFKHAMNVAEFFETPYIRIFTYFLPEGDEDRDKWKEEVMVRTERKVQLAESRGIVLLQENEHDVWFDAPERGSDLVLRIASENLKLIFDPANYVAAGVAPYDDGFELIRDDVVYLHMKDMKKDTHEVVPVGEGDGQCREVLDGFKNQGTMYVALEPHLKFAGQSHGFSGEEMFRTAVTALKKLLDEVGAEYK